MAGVDFPLGFPGRTLAFKVKGNNLFYLIKYISKKSISTAKDFPIVCIGDSAGGSTHITRLLQHLPEDITKEIVRIAHAVK